MDERRRSVIYIFNSLHATSMKGQELAKHANYSHLTVDYIVIRFPCGICWQERQLANKMTSDFQC